MPSIKAVLQVDDAAFHQHRRGGNMYTIPAFSFHLDEDKDHRDRVSTTPNHITVHVDLHVHQHGASASQSGATRSGVTVVPTTPSEDGASNLGPRHQHDHVWLDFGDHFPSWTALSFDFTRSFGWSHFAQSIQDWFVNLNALDDTEEHRWGLDAFWIAYTSAYPSFPRGSWPEWDSRIPIAGKFIENYLKEVLVPVTNAVSNTNSSGSTSTASVLAKRWVLMEGLISELNVGRCV